MKDPILAKRLAQSVESTEYLTEKLILSFTERICELIETEGITRKELADRLGKPKSWVSRFLNGNSNMTVATMVEVMHALGREIVIGDQCMETTNYTQNNTHRQAAHKISATISKPPPHRQAQRIPKQKCAG